MVDINQDMSWGTSVVPWQYLVSVNPQRVLYHSLEWVLLIKIRVLLSSSQRVRSSPEPLMGHRCCLSCVIAKGCSGPVSAISFVVGAQALSLF